MTQCLLQKVIITWRQVTPPFIPVLSFDHCGKVGRENSNPIQSGKSVGMGLAVSDSGATTRMLARNAVRSSSLC
jgi:hypothetical protein